MNVRIQRGALALLCPIPWPPPRILHLGVTEYNQHKQNEIENLCGSSYKCSKWDPKMSLVFSQDLWMAQPRGFRTVTWLDGGGGNFSFLGFVRLLLRFRIFQMLGLTCVSCCQLRSCWFLSLELGLERVSFIRHIFIICNVFYTVIN